MGKQFLKLLQQNESALLTRYNVFQRDQWPDDPVTKANAPKGADPTLAYVFREQMSPELQSALEETSLALPDRLGDRRWVGMHPKLAFVYNAVLAKQMSETRPMLHPLTDETLDHLAIVGWTEERLAQALLDVPMLHGPELTENEIEANLAMVSLQLLIPKGIAHVDIEKIIMLRKQYVAELGQLQEHLHKFASPLEQWKGIENVEDLRDYLEIEYTKKIQPELEDLKKQLKWFNIDTITGAMNMSFVTPVAIVSAAKLIGITALNPIVAATGAFAFGFLKIVGDKHKKNVKALKASNVAYLLRLEKELKPKELLSWVPGHAVKFGFPQ